MDRTLFMGFPLAYQMPTSFFSNWLNMDQSPVMGAITASGVYVTQNMSIIVENALTVAGWERLVVLEHDMACPTDALVRIAAYEPEHAVVGSMYFRRDPPHHANALMEKDGGWFDPISAGTVKKWCDDPQLYEVDAVGFGLTSIARHVLADWDPEIDMFNIDRTFGSHDLWFSHFARKQGHRVFVDSAIVCDHLGFSAVGLADNQRAQHRKPRPPALSVQPRAPAKRR